MDSNHTLDLAAGEWPIDVAGQSLTMRVLAKVTTDAEGGEVYWEYDSTARRLTVHNGISVEELITAIGVVAQKFPHSTD